MLSRASVAQIASGRDSSVTQLSSSQLSSRESVTSNMGRRCAHHGCTRLSLTGGPKCHSHTPKSQTSPPIRGSAQMRITESSSPAHSNVKNESMSPARPDAWPPGPNGPNRKSGESQNPPHPAKGLSHKTLPTKTTARKSIAKPGQRREDSNSAAADEAEIVVASDSATSTNKPKASKRVHDSVPDSPRKKQRPGLSSPTAESGEPKPLTNGATHKVPEKRPDSSISRSSPRPATTTTTTMTTPAASSASFVTAKTDNTDERSRMGSRGSEASPLKPQIPPDTSLHGEYKKGKAKKKKLRNTSAAEHAPAKLEACPTTASPFLPKEGSAERFIREQVLGKSVQGTTSPLTVEPNEGETKQGHPVVPSFPKVSPSFNTMGGPNSMENNGQSAKPVPGPAVKKSPGTSVVNGKIDPQATAQPQTGWSLDVPFSLRPNLKVSGRPAVEPTTPASSTNLLNKAAKPPGLEPAAIPNATAKPQTPGSQPLAPSAVKTKTRTEKAKQKTSGEETAARQVPAPATQPTGMSSRPGLSTLDASSSTDRRNYWATVHETPQTVSRLPSVRDKEPPPNPRDVPSSARNQSARSQPLQTQERPPDAKNGQGQNPPAAPRQSFFSEHYMRTAEIFNRVLEEAKGGKKTPAVNREDSRGPQRQPPLSTHPQAKETVEKPPPAYSERSSALAERTKGQNLIQKETTAPPKNSLPADRAEIWSNQTMPPLKNGVAPTAKLDTTGTKLGGKRNSSTNTGKPPESSRTVIDLISSDSDSPAPSKATPKTKTRNEPREDRPGLRMPSVTTGPIPMPIGTPPKAGPSAKTGSSAKTDMSANGSGEPRRVWQKSSATEDSVPIAPEGRTQVLHNPSASSEPVANMSGGKTSDSDKPLLSPKSRWTNVTAERWAALSLKERKRMLQDQHDESKFDEFIYGTANAANHPRPSSRDMAPVSASPMPKAAPLNNFRHFDPRVHWTHARPKEWHERKQKEIADRGNRKASQNFGQAAARRAQQKASVRPRKVDLPERVEKNPKWMKALAELDDMAESYHEAQRAKARLRKKRHKATKDREGDTEMQDAPPLAPDSTKEAPVIGGMRRPRLEVMMGGRWRERPAEE